MQQITCTITREVDVYLAMSHAREMAQAIGFSQVDRTRIEIVILELTRNLIIHAGGGQVTMGRVDSAARGAGMVIEARDEGPGIADVDLAMQDGYSTTSTMGAGLPGVRRLMDEFTISSAPGAGTQVRVVKWVAPSRRSIYER